MHYCNIKRFDIADGPGVRVTLFVSGCRNKCKGCFQPETWDFSYGDVFTREVEDEILECLSLPYITGLTLLGGEPFEPENQIALVPFLKRVREKFPEKAIWAYSGYTYETLINPEMHPHTDVTEEMLSLIDVLVDGKFVEELKDITLLFRGSSNQRLLDMRKTLEKGEAVLWLPK